MEVVNSVKQETKVQREKKNDALRLVNGKLTNKEKREKEKG